MKSKWIPPSENNDSNKWSEDENELKKSNHSKVEIKSKAIKSKTLNSKTGLSMKSKVMNSSQIGNYVEEHNSMYNEVDEDNRVPWQNWGRKFNPDRLDVHLKSCNNMK